MKFKKLLLASAMATGILQTAGAVDILVESFETDGQGARYTASQPFSDGSSDHWNRTDGSDISNETDPYSGFEGTFFWAAEDTDDDGGDGEDEQTITFSNINIAGFDNLSLSGLFAAGNEGAPGASAYDETDFIIVTYQIDGGVINNGLCFNYEPGTPGQGSTSNEPIGFDANCDGAADGMPSWLENEFREFSFDITETGNLMDIVITVHMDSANEEIAFDNIKLTGDLSGVDNPPAVTSTNPADSAIDVAIDSNVVINFSETVDIEMNGIDVLCATSGLQQFPPVALTGVTSIDMNPNDFSASETCDVTVSEASVTDVDLPADPLDADYVFSFTIEPDSPPFVVSTVPADGATGVALDANFEINFSENINSTISSATLTCGMTVSVLMGATGNDVSQLVLDPAMDMPNGETCTLELYATEITDLDGTADQLDGNGDGTAGDNFTMQISAGTPEVEIFEIQGAGLASPYAGQAVTTNDNIVTAVGPNGFYIQTPDVRDDQVLATSNGIFVYTNNPPTVSVGDMVDVTGDIIEYNGLTEFTNPGSQVINVDSQGNSLPTALILDDTFPSPDPTVFDCGDQALERECFEGMYFEMDQGFVSSASTGFFSFFDITDMFIKAGSSRAYREPGIEYPGLMGLPVFDGNPEIVEMSIDDLGLPYQALSGGTEISAKGIMTESFFDYELHPTELIILNENVIPSTVRAATIDEITIGSANLFRLFNDIDDSGSDDYVEDSQVYADRLAKISNYIVNDMNSPMIIGLQEIENIIVLNDLSAAISNAGGPTYTAALVEGNDQGDIDVGYLYQANFLSNVAITQLGADEFHVFPGNVDDPLHDRPPLQLSADVTVGNALFPINVLVVHMRSRGGIDGSDEDRVRDKRLTQANSVAAMIDGILTNAPNDSVYVIGDFNAFQFTDGYVDVMGQITGTAVAADNLVWTDPLFAADPLTQAVQTLAAENQYSFVFRGSAQVLDNAIMNDVGLMNFNDMEFVRGQADANVSFEDDNATSLRSTDHDGFVLFIKGNDDLIFKNDFE